MRLLSLLAFASALVHCSVPAIVDLTVDVGQYTVSASRITVPDAFQDTSTNTIRTITCDSDAMCPQLGANEPAVHCVSNACDPDPFPFDLATDVIDLGANESVRRYGDNITVIEIRALHYDASSQGLRNPVGPTDLYWGAESAAAIEMGQYLGTIPVVTLDDDTGTASGDVMLDPAGAAALSDYLLHTSRRLRLFARPTIDVSPGGPIPAGDVALHVQMSVHVEGQLVR